MKSIFSKFLCLFSRKEKFQILVIFFLILVGALFETFVVGLIYPFISILKRPEIIYENKILSWIYNILQIKSTKQFLIWITIGIIVIYLIKNSYLVFSTYAQSRFIFNKRISFSRRLLTFYLYQPYTFHLQRNSAELLYKVNMIVPSLFNGFLLFVLMFVIETITTMLILGLLIMVKPIPSLITASVLGITTFIFYRIIRVKIGVLGKLSQCHGEKMVQWVSQGLGGLKETKILGREDFFINMYNKNSIGFVRAEQFVHIINQLPRPFLETMCVICMLIIMLLIVAQDREFQSIIPTLSLFVVAAFRVIPSMNRIFAAATKVRYTKHSLEVIYNDLFLFNKEFGAISKKEACTKISIVFDKVIELKNVYYKYPNATKSALSGISIKIPKYYSVGFVGPSGAGKTTIVDVILGLLIPTQGEMLVDGRNTQEILSSWQYQIGYIPQNIYLSDDTIRHNIAFGLPDEQINEERIWSVLAFAQIEHLVNSLPDKLDAYIGERGIRLSGGQRQRIGIARALYHDPSVLIMDEGTASLDNEMEMAVMQAIRCLSGKKTIIIIAHRLSTVKNCDILYFLKDGKIVDCGTYDALLSKSTEFKTMVMSSNW